MDQLTLPLRCRTPTSPETGVRLRPTRAQGERPRTDIFPALSRGANFLFGRGGAESGPCRASEGLSTGRPMGCPYSPRREAVANRHALQRPCLQAWAETWCDAPPTVPEIGMGKVGKCDPRIVCCHARLCTWQQIETGGGAALQQPVRTTGCLVAVPGQRRPPGATGRGMCEFVPTFPNVV